MAKWQDEHGTSYEWSIALVDSRRSRVLALIDRFGIACDESTLTIVRDTEGAK